MCREEEAQLVRRKRELKAEENVGEQEKTKVLTER